jgi:hypothetical protein
MKSGKTSNTERRTPNAEPAAQKTSIQKSMFSIPTK